MKWLLITILSLCVHGICNAQDASDWVQFGHFSKPGINRTTKKELLSRPVMNCLKKGCKVVSFDIFGEVPPHKQTQHFTSDGNKMSAAQIKYINRLGNKFAIWIYNVRVRCEDGTEKLFGENNTSFAVYYFIVK